MAYIMKTDTTRKKTSSTQRLYIIVKPYGMSLKWWQTALCRKAALKENFGNAEVHPERWPRKYLVMSQATQGRYLVHFYGEGHKLNTCSYMDYQASRFGTCKHLETERIGFQIKRAERSARPTSGFPCPIKNLSCSLFHAGEISEIIPLF